MGRGAKIDWSSSSTRLSHASFQYRLHPARTSAVSAAVTTRALQVDRVADVVHPGPADGVAGLEGHLVDPEPRPQNCSISGMNRIVLELAVLVQRGEDLALAPYLHHLADAQIHRILNRRLSHPHPHHPPSDQVPGLHLRSPAADGLGATPRDRGGQQDQLRGRVRVKDALVFSTPTRSSRSVSGRQRDASPRPRPGDRVGRRWTRSRHRARSSRPRPSSGTVPPALRPSAPRPRRGR